MWNLSLACYQTSTLSNIFSSLKYRFLTEATYYKQNHAFWTFKNLNWLPSYLNCTVMLTGIKRILFLSGVRAVISSIVLSCSTCIFHSCSAIKLIVSFVTQDETGIWKYAKSLDCPCNLVQLLTAHNFCLGGVFPGAGQLLKIVPIVYVITMAP